MRITLVNDTRIEVNPGCHATMAGLESLLHGTTGADLRRLPLGLGHDVFAGVVASGDGRSRKHWCEGVDKLADNPELAAAFGETELVVVNLEGTFHHHTVGALALGGVMALAHRRNVPVWAVNGTVQDIEPWLLQESIARATHLAVREPLSLRWLRERGLRASLSADCALLANIFAAPLSWQLPPRAALYTPGVLGREDQVSPLTWALVGAQLDTLTDRGFTPVYLQVDEAEDWLAREVRARGGHVVQSVNVPWPSFGHLLRGCDLVVSGRYHVLIFAAMAGIPSVALPSNTWKIEGLLAHLGTSQRIAETSDDLRWLLASDTLQAPAPATMTRLRTLANRNVAGHVDARVLRSRTGGRVTVIGPVLDSFTTGNDMAAHCCAWPLAVKGANPVTRLRAALEAVRRPSEVVTVAGLELLPPEQVSDVLLVLRTSGPQQIQVVIDPVASPSWDAAHGTLRPISVWRRLLGVAGFIVDSELACERGHTSGPGDTPASRWTRALPFRDEADQQRRRFTLRAAITPMESGAALPLMRALLGLVRTPEAPSLVADLGLRVLFVVGTHQEFRQYLPLWTRLPACACSVLLKREHGPARRRRQEYAEAWLRSRGIAVRVIGSVRDIVWTDEEMPGPTVLVSGAESTAYDSHLWTGAVVLAARSRGMATLQLQHGIWPYADLERPMTSLSDEVLSWSGEFERACHEHVTWPDGTVGPRAVLDGVRFSAVGCPLFDAYGDSTPSRLEDVLGEWVSTYRRRVLVATNLHWTQHRAGASVTPAVLELAARSADTLFVIKPHPVHDPDPGLLESCPANVVVLDEYCCLFMGIDSTHLVRCCDAVVATQSTVVLEAALAGKPFVVVDTGNPNRYEHVEPVPPSGIGRALEEVLAHGVPGARRFAGHYFDDSLIGRGTDGVVRAVIRAALAGQQPLPAARQLVALTSFAEHFSAYAGELAWDREQLAALQAVADQPDTKGQRSPGSSGASNAAARREPAQLSLRYAAMEQLIAARDEALLRPRKNRRVRVVLFGASTAGRQTLAAVLSLPHIEVIGFADNDPSKWGSHFAGVAVNEPDPAWLRSADAILITSIHRPQIAAQITAAGCTDRVVFDNVALERTTSLAQTA